MKLKAQFYATQQGNEPVREWLIGLGRPDKTIIGTDIATVQRGWPLGMPVVRKMDGYNKLWEIRSKLSDGKIARVLFTLVDDKLILLHGFIKKSQKTPKADIDLAEKRKKEVLTHG